MNLVKKKKSRVKIFFFMTGRMKLQTYIINHFMTKTCLKKLLVRTFLIILTKAFLL